MRCILLFPWRSKSSGFTLVELMITVAIVGVLVLEDTLGEDCLYPADQVLQFL